ncbi:YqaA family protein [Amphritea balenae]|uniref:DedA family protein n=1 Tax=Amphritea balenae TaxID=452629 RepID=A0A3P1SI20_9GAMM|nr:YqaA family protein [Amphritea balenae]RRC96654.1 DedA family protein [Amphritea balenae]GGK74638.1 hypothetical protein GCM10007941_25890 [Amphritea balenae]
MVTDELGLWGLFVSSFVSSTLFPGGSEVLLAYLASESELSSFNLVLTASLGNTLGGIVTFAMGWLIAVYWPLRELNSKFQLRAMKLIRRYGVIAMLFSWVPVIGDPLCLIAGWLKLKPLTSMLLILVGKTLRYALIVSLI